MRLHDAKTKDQKQAEHQAKTYKRLLDECLFALNQLPRQRIPGGDGGDTYKLASKIEATLKSSSA